MSGRRAKQKRQAAHELAQREDLREVEVNLLETARRIHILRRLQERGSTPFNELAAEYNAADMLSVRLDRMVALKQLKEFQGRYFLKARLLWAAGKVLSAWARLLGFSSGQTQNIFKES